MKKGVMRDQKWKRYYKEKYAEYWFTVKCHFSKEPIPNLVNFNTNPANPFKISKFLGRVDINLRWQHFIISILKQFVGGIISVLGLFIFVKRNEK